MGVILQFVILQDVLMHGVSTDPSICDTVTFVHEAHGVSEVQPCHYFTSRESLENYIANNTINAEIDSCRSSINMMLEINSFHSECTAYVDDELCYDFDDLTFYYCNAPWHCTELSKFANLPFEKLKKVFDMWDEYIQLGGGPSAIAAICYAPNDILDDIVNAGNTLHKTFTRAINKLYSNPAAISFQ
jgi:hypothetical protein